MSRIFASASALSATVRTLIAAWVFACAAVSASAAEQGQSGQQAMPAIELVRSGGGLANTEQWLGKPLVINVWATWCPPCRTEMPSLVKLSKLLVPSGIKVYALSVDSDPKLAHDFMRKYNIDLPNGIAANPGQAMAAFDAYALPLTLYVSADGRIVGRHVGMRDWAEEGIVRELRALLLPASAAPKP